MSKRRYWSHRELPTSFVPAMTFDEVYAFARFAGFDEHETRPRRRVFVPEIPRGLDLERRLAGVDDVSVFHDGHHVVIRRDDLTILDGRQWYGDGYDPAIADRAWSWIEGAARRLWREPELRLLSTPGTTGRDWWLRTPAADDCPIMSPEWQDAIRATAGQGRIETLPRAAEVVPALHEYDLRIAYAAVLRGLPVGDPIDYVGMPDKHARSRMLVRFRPPAGWDRVGILGVRVEVAGEARWSWPTSHEWHGPTWVDGCEVHLALEHGWSVEVERAYVWTDTRDPLRTWSDRLLKIIVRAADELSPAGAAHVRSAVRAIILHTIGAFHGRPQRVTCWADDLSGAPLGADMLRAHADGRVSWREERPPAWPEASHPEWSSHVWARSRVRLLSTPGGGGALTIPRRSIVAIRTDAVYTTEPTGWERFDDGKPGRWVLKNTHPGGPWPRTGDDVLAMKAGER